MSTEPEPSGVRIQKSHYYLCNVLITVNWYYPGTPEKRAISNVRIRSTTQNFETVQEFAKKLPAFLKELEAQEEE